MLRDLGKTPPPTGPVRSDVLIIGGGIAGLVLASRLAKNGIRSLVLESGTETGLPGPHPLNEVVQVGQPYRGARSGRLRGLGGTSARWGGAMLPFIPCDMQRHTAKWSVDWPVTLDELAPRFAELERLFDLPGGSFDTERNGSPDTSGFHLRSAKWPAFGRRNIATALREELASPLIEIWLNATATKLRMDENGRIREVSAASASGHKLTAQGDLVVIAAGAIESTRLLLLLDRQHNNRIFKPDGQLGRYFYDHLAAPAAVIKPTNRTKLNETFAMRFVRSGMRDLRIEPSAGLRRRLELPGAYAHVTTDSTGQDAYSALRGIYLNIQSRAPLDWVHVSQLGQDLTWLLQAARWRFLKRRLLAPRNSTFKLNLVIEQFPDAANTVSLSPDKADYFGMPLALISWKINRQDLETFRTLQSQLTAYWRSSPFAALGGLEPTPSQDVEEFLCNDSDIFHPGGSTRMGRTAASGVLRPDLSTHRIDNLYVVSTSAFPSGGSANPTFMLMAFALRLAEEIAKKVRGEKPVAVQYQTA